MAETSYIYIVATDFPNAKVDPFRLSQEIDGSDIVTNLSKILISIDPVDNKNKCYIWFVDALSTGDKTILDSIVASHSGDPWVWPQTDIRYWLDPDVIVEDPETEISGPFTIMQCLIDRRELFNDIESPIYIEGHTPILGENGWAVDHANRINNLETIHAKLGWHNQQILQSTYTRPKDLLIYYGYLNSFNYGVNQWNNEKVAQDLAKYNLLVFGDGIQNPSHEDYANTQIIIPRIKALNPNALIFGYVTVNQSLNDFQTKTDQWNTLAVHGIFMDEAGYDYGKNRVDFNTQVDYVHGKSVSNKCFANAWNPDHILGTNNDPSYPNSTWNPDLVASNLNINDWILLESFGSNTTAYTDTQGYEPKAQWAARGVKAIGLRATFGVNFAGVGIINNDNGSGQNLFNFSFISALMWSLEGYGTSDTSYAASSATVTHWTRPDVTEMGVIWSLSPSIQVDQIDADVYHRYVEYAKMTLDFSASAQASSITKW